MEQQPTDAILATLENAADIAAARQERLRRFRGPLEQRDDEVLEHWRQATPEAHAQAMIGLARVAEMIVAHTGFSKDPAEMFPGFPPSRPDRNGLR